LFLFKHFINNQLIPITKERVDSILMSESNHMLDACKATSEEEKYVFLINKLVTFDKFTNLRQIFLNRLKTLIISNRFNDYYNLRMGRLICYLCRSTRLIEMMHLIIYDIIIAKTRNFHLILVLFFRTWPEPFEIASAEISPLWTSIIFLIKNQIKNKTSEEWRHLDAVFTRLHQWRVEFNDIDELSAKLVNDLSKLSAIFTTNDEKFQLTNEANEYLASFQLICSYQEWLWSKNKLFQLIRQSSKSNEELEIFLMICQAKISIQSSDKAFIDELTNELMEKLKLRLFPFVTIESLLLLIPHNTQKIISAIELWLENYQKSLPINLSVKINRILSYYKT
jgi:hypothetical protein